MMAGPDRYDPSEVDERPSSAYLTKKDARNLGIVIVVLLLLMWPVYRLLKGQSEASICVGNLQKIGLAMNLYTQLWDERFPPPFMSAQRWDVPYIGEDGEAFTWASVVSPYVRDERNADTAAADVAAFTCPSADEAEYSLSENMKGGRVLRTTYGMFAPYAAAFQSIVSNPQQTVLVAETSNFGALDTFNPLKFERPDGSEIRQDGFLIGFDNGQFYPTKDTQWVTRLAFPDSAGPSFSEETSGRHGPQINVLTVEGGFARIRAGSARYEPGLGSWWNVPAQPPAYMRR